MEFITALIAFAILDIAYLFGKIYFVLKSGMYDSHYFLGYNPKLADLKIGGVKFSIGIYIPIFPFDRIYKVEDGKKERITMPWEFHGFPIWKRLMVTFGGVFSLMAVGIITFMVLAWTSDEKYTSKAEANRFGIYPSELAIQAGFQKGDKILRIDGKDYEKFEDIISPQQPARYNILRGGKTIELAINQEVIDEFSKTLMPFFYLDTPFEVLKVTNSSAAEEAGLKAGDKIKSVNGKPIITFFDLKYELAKYKNESALLTIERVEGKDKELLTMEVKPDGYGKIGIQPNALIKYSTKEHSIAEAVFIGFKNFFLTGYNTIRGFYKIFSGEVVQHSGPIGIAPTFGSPWKGIWAIVSGWAVGLVILNLLPLPRSCFWQVIPLAYEGIAKKVFPLKYFKLFRRLSYIFLASLLFAAVISDLIRISAHHT
jgi:regulator of sigma E protease